MAQTEANSSGIARGNAGDLLKLIRDLFLPTMSKGVLKRRPMIVGVLEKTGCEAKAIDCMRGLRSKYGARPVLLSLFGRKQLFITDKKSMQRVLHETPDAFQSSSDEKSAALAHFEPGASLISDGAERKVRREFNSRILDEGCPRHRMAAQFRKVVRDEITEMLDGLEAEGKTVLDWDRFFAAWNRIVRRILLGDYARDDEVLTEKLEKLRAAGNFAFLHPGHNELRAEFHQRLQICLERAEWPSLAGLVGQVPGRSLARPTDQFTHYMFAFDPGGMSTFRTLALLATHENFMTEVRAELDDAEADAIPRLRAAFLESLRLWPTTPVILRQARDDVEWEGDTIPAGTQVIIYAPYFHRNPDVVDAADRFAPELWPEGRVQRDSRFVPFSEGDGICPARDLVPLTGAMALAEILTRHRVKMRDADRLDPTQPLPPTLDNYTLEFELEPR
jgi:cytochrome P450